MSHFTLHTIESAPSDSVPTLDAARKAFGSIPNLIAVLAESPAAVKGYLTLSSIFDESSFSDTEKQVVILTASRYNECHYCMAAHSTVADMQKVDAEVTNAIRNDLPITDPKLEALRQFTLAVTDKRGWVSDQDYQDFVAAGYDRQQVIEVVLGVTFKTFSNYLNHIADVPVDAMFNPRAWSASENRKAS